VNENSPRHRAADETLEGAHKGELIMLPPYLWRANYMLGRFQTTKLLLETYHVLETPVSLLGTASDIDDSPFGGGLSEVCGAIRATQAAITSLLGLEVVGAATARQDAAALRARAADVVLYLHPNGLAIELRDPTGCALSLGDPALQVALLWDADACEGFETEVLALEPEQPMLCMLFNYYPEWGAAPENRAATELLHGLVIGPALLGPRVLFEPQRPGAEDAED
jgi:hypothetical protein